MTPAISGDACNRMDPVADCADTGDVADPAATASITPQPGITLRNRQE